MSALLAGLKTMKTHRQNTLGVTCGRIVPKLSTVLLTALWFRPWWQYGQ